MNRCIYTTRNVKLYLLCACVAIAQLVVYSISCYALTLKHCNEIMWKKKEKEEDTNTTIYKHFKFLFISICTYKFNATIGIKMSSFAIYFSWNVERKKYKNPFWTLFFPFLQLRLIEVFFRNNLVVLWYSGKNLVIL